MPTAIITAAADGIGRAVALSFAEAGFDLALNDVDREKLEATNQVIGGRTRTALACGDISDPEVRSTLLNAARKLGELKVLVNNAGIALPRAYPEAASTDWRRLLEINLLAPMELIQEVLPDLRAGGGAIVNVASTGGLGIKSYADPDYAASKAALIRLSAALGQIQHKPSVRVNAILPDWVRTPAVEKTKAITPPERWAEIAPSHLVEPEEISRQILRLALDETLSGMVLNCPASGKWEFLSSYGA